MWLWLIILCAFLCAVFLIISLAQLEAGRKTKSKWPSFFFCSLAVLAVLIFFKPKPGVNQVKYIPTPVIPYDEGVKSTQAPNQSTDHTADTAKVPGIAIDAVTQGGAISKQPESQENFEQKKDTNKEAVSKGPVLDESDYQDPVLMELMELKRKAAENKGESPSEISSVETPMESFHDAGALVPDRQVVVSSEVNQQSSQQQQEPELKQVINQKVVKARVTVERLNVREQGNISEKIVSTLKKDEVIEILNYTEAGDWINIRLSSGEMGWVVKKYVKIIF